MLRRFAICTAAAALVAAAAVSAGSAASARPGTPAGDAASLALLVAQLPLDYEAADRTHDEEAAAALRRRVAVAAAEAVRLQRQGPAAELRRLERMLATTKVRLQPWPFVAQVRSLGAAAARGLPRRTAEDEDVYGAIDDGLDAAQTDLDRGATGAAAFQLAAAEARYQAGPGKRLQALDPALAAQTLAHLDRGEIGKARDDVKLTAQTLGEVTVSRATIVGDAAVIVFREGLEAVLILAALTASFVGARRHLRPPVLVGAVLGLVATAITWVIAQTIVHSLSSGGLELQAITGLLAIGVLLLVTNWFFHRIYWSEWIGRFNKRRKSLEGLDGASILSGQLMGFVLLGLTSVYREGFETVLFLQSLQVSAGTGATMLGVAIGLAATLAVGTVTFLMQRKLPYKRMLIVTGVLIALVLAVMVGITAHTMQGLGWLPIHDTPFRTPFWATTWLGLFPTWETLGAQAGSLVFVIGSYALARTLQKQRYRSSSRFAVRAIRRPFGREALPQHEEV
ncbi:MAG TPA: FTR1 family protein [Gaiellaceae bacterium]|nr:FTR1 family protein [Gaiellaceae bacterium]